MLGHPRRPACAVVSFCALALGCSDEASAPPTPQHDASIPDGNVDGGDPCIRKSCAALGASCGSAPDGCGGLVQCGECPAAQYCGGAGSNRCGTETCLPKSCADLNAECGVVSDGCGEAIPCGQCSPPSTCGGAGIENRCGCIPATCAALDLQCGTAPDGCGSALQCGDCAPGALCSSGKCEVSCPATWKTQTGSGLFGVALLGDGDLVVAGDSASQGWVATVDSCAGSVGLTRTVTVAGASMSYNRSVAVAGNDVFLAGSLKTAEDPSNGMLARVDGSNLTVAWAKALVGSELPDEAWSVAVGSGGSIWVAGSASGNGTSYRPWLVKASASGGACGVQPFPGKEGHARTIVATQNAIYVAGALDGSAFVARFDPSCACPSGCVPTWQSAPVAIGATYTEGRSLVVSGNAAWVGGHSMDDATGSDTKAFVARLDSSTGKVTGTWVWNPTAALDTVASLRTDGQRLYAAIMAGYETSAPAGTKGHLVALPQVITSATTPEWSVTLPFMNAALGVEVESGASGGVYVVGRSATSGWVARCTKAGVCPN